MSLGLFEKLIPNMKDLGERRSAKQYHLMIECLRSSFADARKYITDPNVMNYSPAELLFNENLLRNRLNRVNPKHVESYRDVSSLPFSSSNTVSFQVVDKFGNAVSMVNSTYEGFGTGICPSGTGFSLQSRGSNFSLNESSLNRVEGNKRPYHTIIPGLSLYKKDQSLHSSFTVMGAFMQPQGHFQILSNLIDWNDSPQEALDEPRFCLQAGLSDSDDDLKVFFEDGFDPKVLKELKTEFHHKIELKEGYDRALFGRGQIILRKDDVLYGGSDGRADGCAIPGF